VYGSLVRGILKGVLAMALADGELQPEEQEVLQTLQERFGLQEGEIVSAIGDARKLTPEQMAAQLDHEDKVTVAQYAAMTAYADGTVQGSEDQFLEKLERRFELTPKETRRLEELCRELARVASSRPIDVEALINVTETY